MSRPGDFSAQAHMPQACEAQRAAAKTPAQQKGRQR
jgi:hypothetical protein